MPQGQRIVNNKKYLWDGATYPQEAEATRAAEAYREARFEAQVVAEGGQWLVFTRRPVAPAPPK